MTEGPDFCLDRFPGTGTDPLVFDPSISAGWYSAVCALIASSVIIGLQLRLTRRHERQEWAALILLTLTFVVAIIAAFINAETAGEKECNLQAARVGVAGALMGSGALLLLCSLAWLLAEHRDSNAPLPLLHALFLFSSVVVLAYLSTTIYYSERTIRGSTPDVNAWIWMLVPPGTALAGAAVLRWGWRRRRSDGLTATLMLRERRFFIWTLCVAALAAIAVLIGVDAYLAHISTTQPSLGSIYPDWMKYAVVWATSGVAVSTFLAFPWRGAIRPQGAAAPGASAEVEGRLADG